MTIQKRLLSIIKSDKTDVAVTVATAAVSAANPLTGIFLTAVHEISGLADEIRIDAVIKGLSTELNQEDQVNQLYGYVEKSEENAFYVVNTLRKALLADSLIACTIMGRMLACHIDGKTPYDQNDNIIFHALESATDDDITQFYEVMKEHMAKDEDGNDVFHIPNCVMENDDFMASLDWCVFNRLFNGTSGVSWTDEGQNYDKSHSPNNAAFRLKEYVDSVKQVLEYGK
ncbi:MAG: hypothetical protein IJ794_11160 [Lachnospiraceae bacterium]|nr:hypothetical protein [Lachnospiraceae bacterium]